MDVEQVGFSSAAVYCGGGYSAPFIWGGMYAVSNPPGVMAHSSIWHSVVARYRSLLGPDWARWVHGVRTQSVPRLCVPHAHFHSGSKSQLVIWARPS